MTNKETNKEADAQPGRQPDIEIYLKQVALDSILEWLTHHFEITLQQQIASTSKLNLVFNGQPVTCTIVEKAAKGGYTSIWFKTNQTPWATDEECAREAFQHFKSEIRCSVGGWVADSPGADSPGADSPGADSPGADSPGVDSPGADSPGAESMDTQGWYRFTDKGQSIVNWLT